jgi:hypothetical protein
MPSPKLSSLEARVGSEIESLHEFFVGWFTGALPNSDTVFQSDFEQRFGDDFLLIPPGGEQLDLPTLAAGLRAAHGGNPGFRIAIRRVTVRGCWDDMMLATYEEWQRNAVNSSPPDNGRIATALFQTGERLRWQHVHETWLPADVMRAGPYDF